MGYLSFLLIFYFSLSQTNLCSSGSKIKVLENVFRGEIYLLREEIKIIATQQEVVMKTLNETIELLQDPTRHANKETKDTDKNTFKTYKDTKSSSQILKEISDEFIRTKRGLMQEKVARKQDKETIISAINNNTAAITSKLSVTLDKLGDKVTNLEQKLNVQESLQESARQETRENLFQIKRTISDYSLQSLENISILQTDINDFKTTQAILTDLSKDYHNFITTTKKIASILTKDYNMKWKIPECGSSEKYKTTATTESESCLQQYITTFMNKFLPLVRLVNSDRFNEGRVEIFYDGAYGTVCNDDWHDTDARVVCRMLGFSTGEAVHGLGDNKPEFGAGVGKILLDNVRCTGNEASLFDCGNNGIGIHNCDHYEDAGVRCKWHKMLIITATDKREFSHIIFPHIVYIFTTYVLWRNKKYVGTFFV